jgi:hypothetical protein
MSEICLFSGELNFTMSYSLPVAAVGGGAKNSSGLTGLSGLTGQPAPPDNPDSTTRQTSW